MFRGAPCGAASRVRSFTGRKRSSMDTFKSRSTLKVGNKSYTFYRVNAVPGAEKLPFSIRILIENLLRREDGQVVTEGMIKCLCQWSPRKVAAEEIAFMPSRVLMQDFTGVP